MKMIEKIRQKIEELKAELEKGNYYLDNHEQAVGYEAAIDDLAKFLDTLEEPEVVNDLTDDSTKAVRLPDGRYVTEKLAKEIEEPVCEGVEEAAEQYAYSGTPDEWRPRLKPIADEIIKNFIAGAKWQADHTPLPEDTILFNKGVEEGRRLERDEFEKNRLAACSNQTKEEYDRETDFALEIIKKEHRQPTFSDAINYGMRLQKEQMMKEAVEGEVVKDISNKLAVAARKINLDGFKFGDKVKIIIVKE